MPPSLTPPSTPPSVTPPPAARRVLNPGSNAAGVRGLAVRARVAARRPSAPLRTLPDFLVIGTQRGGTTSLYNYLAQHPQVRPPVLKEPQYFSHRHSLGLSWYRSLFPLRGRGGATFEASPYYLFHPLAPERAAETVPSARLIALLRDPAERAYSHYRHSVRLGYESHSFADALALEASRLDGEADRIQRDPTYLGERHRWFSYAARGRYAEQLRRWLALFPRRQLLVLRSEDLFAAPDTCYATVLDFLGLAPYSPAAFEVFTKSGPGAPGPEREVRDRLTAEFAGPNAELEDLLGTRMAWSA